MKLVRKYFLFWWLMVTPAMAYLQDSSLSFIKSVKGDITDFAADNLDNIYLFNSANQLKKINAAGDSVAVFNDIKKFGQASYIDVSNPLRILLYYRNFSTIVILDRLLNIRTTIDLRKADIYQVQAIGLSYDNNIWLYDELANKLKKIDETGKLLLETPDFRQLFDEAPSPQRIFDRDGFVYLYDNQKAVYIFDYYGSLKNNLKITGWENFNVIDKSVFGTTGDTLHRYNIGSFTINNEKLPAGTAGFIKIDFTRSKFYALKKGELEIYGLK